MQSVKVFISWSGERSKSAALLLSDAIKSIDEEIEVWNADTDIAQGDIWPAEILDHLCASDVGIICLTKENIHKPWINFEAGVLYRGSKNKKIHPIFIESKLPVISPPLGIFQCKIIDEKTFSEIVEECASISKSVYDESNINSCWNTISKEIDALKNSTSNTEKMLSREMKIRLNQVIKGVNRRVKMGEDKEAELNNAISRIRKYCEGTPEEIEEAVRLLKEKIEN